MFLDLFPIILGKRRGKPTKTHQQVRDLSVASAILQRSFLALSAHSLLHAGFSLRCLSQRFEVRLRCSAPYPDLALQAARDEGRWNLSSPVFLILCAPTEIHLTEVLNALPHY